MSALAQQQQMLQQPYAMAPPTHKQTNLFVGSISGGITDDFLNKLLSVRALHLVCSQPLPSNHRHADQ